MGFELILFFALGGLALIFAVGMLLSENAVHSALFLIGNFGCVAFLFVLLDAPFIAMVQIAVYAGAIMVLFLFVIMLLGAERTTDTTRRFRWLTGTATTLALALLSAFAIPLVLAGLNLPQSPGRDPMIRVAHGANTPLVDITLSGGGLAEPVVLAGLDFGDITDFATVPPGDYTVTVSLAEAGIPIASQVVSLSGDDVVTAVAYGEFSTDAQTFAINLLPADLTAPASNTARVVVFNGFSEAPLTVVDLGPNDALDTRQRTVEDEDGTSRTETYISELIVAEDVAFGTVSAPIDFSKGTYTLGILSPDNEILLRVYDFEFASDTERTLVLIAEPAQVEGGTARLRVLDRDGDSLVINTQAQFGSPRGIGQLLFTDYLLPVNLVGFLLLVGLVGVIVLARPDGQKRERRIPARRKVSRPLVSVISQQTGSDLVQGTPKLDQPAESGD